MSDHRMTKQDRLEQRIADCFSDWDGDFDVDVEQEDADVDVAYFAVIINHRFLGGDHCFSARVRGADCEMDFNDDTWCQITTENLFTCMWFDMAHKGAAQVKL